MRPSLLIAFALVLGSAGLGHAGDVARIADVQVKRDSPDQPGIYHISVTIEHEDAGWQDYVEAWEIFGPDGEVLGVRPFFEPELEQPKTVSALAGVVIPEDIKSVTIRARTHPGGFEGAPVEVDIPH
ncbi:MAG: hypothetical protein OEU92_18360 [Alphaproteobacteria bacterium]|nr:hypothetical protein [Alphaproteobacteria bacterium]